VIPGVGYCDNFIGASGGEQLFQAGFDGGFGAYDGFPKAALDGGAFKVIPEGVHRVDGWEKFDGLIADEAEEALLRRGEKAACGFVALGNDYRDGNDEPRLAEGRGGAEVCAIEMR